MIDFNKYNNSDTGYLIVGEPDEYMFSKIALNTEKQQQTFYIFITQNEVNQRIIDDRIRVVAFSDNLKNDLNNLFIQLNIAEIELVAETDDKERHQFVFNLLKGEEENIKFLQRMKYSVFVKTAFLNSFQLINPLINFTSFYDGQTAVVLGASPSLDLHLPWVKQNQDKLVIFAVARLAKKLYQEKIKVDFFIASDPTEATNSHAADLEKFQNSSVLIAQHYASPSLLEKWQGHLLYWGAEFPDQSRMFVGAKNVELVSGTVGNLALMSALGMGCKTVYMTGMDLCFADLANTHESSSIEASKKHQFNAPEEVETYQGTIAKTTVEFKKALEAFNPQMQSLVNDYGLADDFQVYNLSSVAGRVVGIDYLDFQEIILPSKNKHDIKCFMDGFASHEKVSKERIKNKQKHLATLNKNYRDLIKICQQATTMLAGYSEFSVEIPEVFAEFSQKVAKFEKGLQKCFRGEGADKFFKLYGYKNFSELLNVSNALDLNPQDPKLLYLYFKLLFSSYSKVALELIQIFELVSKNTQYLNLEKKCNDDISKLRLLWVKNNKINRFLAWKEKNLKNYKNWTEQQQNDYKKCIELVQIDKKRLDKVAEQTMNIFAQKTDKDLE